MLFKNAKLALLVTSFALMADAKKGKWGPKRDSSEEITPETDDGIVADSPQEPGDDLVKRLKKNKKQKSQGKGKKGKGNEKDFAKGVLSTVFDSIPEGQDSITLEELGDLFGAIMGEDFDPEDNRAFERGSEFADKKIYDQPGCRKECKTDPLAEDCESCCVTYMHEVDWNCGSTDDANPPAKCCTEWTEDCWSKDSELNNGHACKDCGYGYGRGYGYGGYGYGRGYGYRG